ncbi:MAG: hypothetical protein ACPGVD_03180 [Flavobacteriales bacterium]
MKTFLFAILLSIIFFACKTLEPKQVVYDNFVFRDFFCYETFDSILNLGFKTDGEHYIKVSYRKKIKSVVDIKPEELKEMERVILSYSKSKLIYVLAQNTCGNEDEQDDFLFDLDSSLLYYVALIPIK